MWLFPFSFCSLQLRVIFKLLEIAPSFRICIISSRLRETCCCGITLTTPPPPRSESRWHSGCCFMGSGSCWQHATPGSAVSAVSRRPAGSALDSGLSVAAFSGQARTHAATIPAAPSTRWAVRKSCIVTPCSVQWVAGAVLHGVTGGIFYQKFQRVTKEKWSFQIPYWLSMTCFFSESLVMGGARIKTLTGFLLQLVAADKPTPNTQTPSSGEILMESGLNKVSRVQWRVENSTV